MMIQQQYQESAAQLHKLFPFVAFSKITKQLQKHRGNIEEVTKKLKEKNHKNAEIINKYKIKIEDYENLVNQFSQLSTHQIINLIKKQDGNLVSVRQKLKQKSQKLPVKEKQFHILAESEMFLQLRNHFNFIPHDKFLKKIEHLCNDLEKLNQQHKKKLQKQTKKDKTSTQVKKNQKNHQKQSQAIQILKSMFPDVKQDKLERLLKKYHHNVSQIVDHLNQKSEKKQHKIFQLEKSVQNIVIDGNNLLYVNDVIRKITLKKGMQQGSLAFAEIVNQINKKFNKKILLIYDTSNIKQQFSHIKLDVARPKYQTSDDYIAEYSRSLNQIEKQKTLFITSDVGLQNRIKQNHCENIVKSKSFVAYCQKNLPNLEQILAKYL